ncbi:UNVERIFIED_CONTAM: hypothetical protein FKN15_014001 [Acipenser sinensis]
MPTKPCEGCITHIHGFDAKDEDDKVYSSQQQNGLLLMALKMKHKLTKEAVSDMLDIINLLAGKDTVPQSWYHLEKQFEGLKDFVEIHHVCNFCGSYLGKETSEKCTYCEKEWIEQRSLKEGNFFFHLPLHAQIKAFLEDPELSQKVSETTALIAYKVLNHVINLFKETPTPVAWDLSKLHNFRNILFRQTEKLEECMVGQTAFAGDLHFFADRSELLKTYFDKMENVLKDKGGNFPEQCKKENVQVAVPLDAYEITQDSQIEDIKMTIYESLKHINIIFMNGQKKPATWNKTNLDNFHNILNRQVQGVRQCVEVDNGTPFSGDGDSQPQGSHLMLKAYFEKLENVLKDEEWGIDVFCTVHDNASNMNLALEICDQFPNDLGCSGHTLQLAIKAGLRRFRLS